MVWKGRSSFPLDDLVSMLTLFFWECRCSSQLCLDLLRLLEDKTLAFVGRPSQNWLVTMLWKSESFRPQARVVDMCASCFLLGMGGYVAPRTLRGRGHFFFESNPCFFFAFLCFF